jgi:hypothetical protein
MWATVWRFVIDPEHREEFEREYGPEGAWAAFFREGDGYVFTELYQSARARDEYVTFDWWQSASAYEWFHVMHRRRYEEIDRRFQRLTVQEVRVGALEG